MMTWGKGEEGKEGKIRWAMEMGGKGGEMMGA
jgi:hypothetical protein